MGWGKCVAPNEYARPDTIDASDGQTVTFLEDHFRPRGRNSPVHNPSIVSTLIATNLVRKLLSFRRLPTVSSDSSGSPFVRVAGGTEPAFQDSI